MTNKQKINTQMKIDLHVHSSERSSCAHASAAEMIEAAIDAGLDAIVFTDHGKFVQQQELSHLNEKYAPFHIFGGIELGIQAEHLIVLGINDTKLETTEWTYPELHKFCKNNKGFIILAHPYRFSKEISIDIDQYPPDAVELYSTHTPLKEKDSIIKLASNLNMQKLCNSDAHLTEFIGQYYNILDNFPADEQELIQTLKKGQFTRKVLNQDTPSKS